MKLALAILVYFSQYVNLADSKGAGECAMLCNDLRLEVLTNEMCR